MKRSSAWLCRASVSVCVAAVPAFAQDDSAARCMVAAERYDTLRIGPDPIYVEHQTAESDAEGRVLILGRRNYRFARDGSGKWTMLAGERILGVVVGPDRRGSIVRPPIDAKLLDGMRAVPNGRGWSVVFAELMERDSAGADEAMAALWYGEYDGSRWTALERIPTPKATLQGTRASSLARTRTGLAWIIVTGGGQEFPALLVLKRENGVWRSERVSTITPAAEPFPQPSGELMLAAIQGDTTLRTDGSSLLLRSERKGWGVVEVLRRSQEEPVNRLESRSFGEITTLTWKTPRAPRLESARAFIADGSSRQIVTVDSAITSTSPLAPVRLPGMGLTWATQHRPASGAVEILFHSLDPAGGIRRLGSLPNPFYGGFRPVARGRDILLTGAVTYLNQYVASLLIEVSVGCNGARR